MAGKKKTPYEEAKRKPLGEGSRFKAVEAAAKKGGARSPGGVAYAVGVKKHGKKKMTELAQKGRRKKK